ncbi:MAG: right-handed parallel beta-helix repeat-containing protein [Chloroflexi bacterium]|nr:right-handed parallel beta-helix repeat-containing protein [Chloroflexota bacterium]
MSEATIANNDVTSDAGGACLFLAEVSIINSTFSDNTAGGNGGGLYANSTGTMTNSTFSGNSATVSGGGIYVSGSATLALNNNLIANSPGGGDCVRINGTVNAQHSLIRSGLGCVTGTNIASLTGDPLLGPLADNGSATQTFALLPGSPAINAGSNAWPSICWACHSPLTSAAPVSRVSTVPRSTSVLSRPIWSP